MELYKGKGWDVIFGIWCQDHPGYCIVGNNKESLSELTNDDWIELGKIEKEIERVCKKVLGATMYNFACLMNNAYRDNKTPFVHFHFVPRYKEKINIVGKDYVDKHFGYNFWRWKNYRLKRQKDIFTEEEKNKIYELMKNEFKL